MVDIVSGWSDEKEVALVIRDGESVTCKKVPARWSAFVQNVDAGDLRVLQREPEVIAVVQDGAYRRIDFRTRWGRRDICKRISAAIQSKQQIAHLTDGDTSELEGLYEADVMPLRRLLSDVGSINIGNPRVGYFDLETDSRKSFDQATDGRARVLSWAVTDSDANLVGSDVLREDTDEAERALLLGFYRCIERFDCMLAWNGDGFDFPVLRGRTERLRVKLGPNRAVIWDRWCWLDQLQVYKKYNQAHESGEERVSFRLNAVAMHLLGVGKDTFDATKTWQAWEAGGERREQLVRYNEQDTKLLPRIEMKTGFVALHIAVCQVTRCLPDSQSLGAAQQGDGYLLRLGALNGYRFPSKRFRDEDDEEGQFAGAFVMDPKKSGIIDDVHVCDFAGLYPSIMRSWNMSLDTVLTFMQAKTWGGPKCQLPDRQTFFRTDKRGILTLALDQLVSERSEYTKRADAAETDSPEWHKYKRLSSGYKIVNNSMYGIVGSPFTRFFNREIAEGVTQTGAWLIKHVAAVSTRAGLDPFYGDTDSVFVQGAEADFGRVVQTLNDAWPSLLEQYGCTESRIKLEFEKSFRRMVMVSKKRYAAKYSRYKGKPAPADMAPEVKGLEYKRGDTIRLARDMQKQCIDRLLDAKGAPDVVEMREFVRTWRERLLRGELTLDEVKLSQAVKSLREYKDRYTSPKCTSKLANKKKSCGFDFKSTDVQTTKGEEFKPQQCQRCKMPRKLAVHPANARVAKILAARGEEIQAGTRVEYVIVGGADGQDDDNINAIPAHDEGALEQIDRDYYWDSRVFPPTQRLLEVAYPGHDWKDTAARRAKIVDAEAAARVRAENRGKVVDLPLFGGTPAAAEPVATESTMAGHREPTAGGQASLPAVPTDEPPGPLFTQPKRARRAPRKVVQEAPEVSISVDANKVATGALEALRAALEAHPGPCPVTLRLRITDAAAVTVIRTGVSVAMTPAARTAIARVLPTSEVTGF